MKKLAATLLLLLSTATFAQNAPAQIKSPEVLPDHRVTFRLRAPKASDVTLTADWLAPNTTAKLTKDDAGIWSVTLGPLATGVAIYNFNLDGTPIADPVNPRIKLRAATSASFVEVPADGTELWEIQNVPHGKTEINYLPTKVLNDQTREVRVYTPPRYDADATATFPIVYLLHGSNDTAAGWTDAGRANYILDNLIARQKARPMIIVMPWGHALPYGAPQAGNNTLFEKYLLEDLLPVIEKKYRITPGRENRAIVGLSMGGAQALSIGLNHLDLFGGIGAFSATISNDFETRYKMLLDDPAATNAKLHPFYIGCGKLDPAFAGNQRLDALLTAHTITHVFTASEGYHNFTNWRLYLGQTAPLLFQNAPK